MMTSRRDMLRLGPGFAGAGRLSRRVWAEAIPTLAKPV
jgi:hypothetical protein